MTYILIFVTVVVSIACFQNRAWFDLLSLQPYRVVRKREWWRVLTHVFVHGDWVHLLVNMFVLFSFGGYLEKLFKTYEQIGAIGSTYLSYFLLFFGAAVVSSIHDLMKQRDNPRFVSVGASGAVSAVIFATIFFNPWNKLYLFAAIPIPGIIFGVFYILYSQYMGRRGGDNINHNAHLYGALFGFIFPLLIDPQFIRIFWNNLTDF